MNTKNRKKAARIQGGWAVSATANVRSDKEKPKMPVTPAWLGKNVDNPSQNDKKYVYEQPPEEEVRKRTDFDKSSVKVIHLYPVTLFHELFRTFFSISSVCLGSGHRNKR